MTRNPRPKPVDGSVDVSWMEDALCREVDGDLFFPTPKAPVVALTQVRQICASCDVREQCLQFALTTAEPEGIWAGTTPRQRSLMLGRML